MKTKKPDTEVISIQQIRDDLNGFVSGLAKGRKYMIVRRSKKVAEVQGSIGGKEQVPGDKKAIQEFIKHARQARSQAAGTFNPDKPIKELYAQSIGEKHGVYRRKRTS